MDENLPACIQYWLHEAKHDCFFVVGFENEPTERIGTVKSILLGYSEPLRAMLQDSELAEKKDIRLKDIEPETFWNFLKCVYGASKIIIPKLNFEQSAKLLYVVEKYLVNDVKSDLIEHINNLFSTDTLFVALSHPVCYEEKGLKKQITDILKKDFKGVVTNDQFLELSYATLWWILQIEYLMVREVEIWEAVVRWAKHNTGSSDGKVLRSQMLGLLKYIRFLTMDQREFSENVVSSEILNEEEIKDLCCAFMLGKHCASEHLSNNTNSRFKHVPVSKHIIGRLAVNYACIHFSVNDVSKLVTNQYHYSDSYCWAGHLWKLLILKESENNIDSLAIFLVCKSEESDWECSVDIAVILKNQSIKSDLRFRTNAKFCPSRPNLGFCKAIGWSNLINPNSGFVKDDSIIIHVTIQLRDV